MAATYVGGYRTALLVAGAGALYLADIMDWNTSYRIMALMMLVGIITTLIIREPEARINEQTRRMEADLEAGLGVNPGGGPRQRFKAWFSDAVVAPFVDFFQRYSTHALIILALVGLYKLSDITMGAMAMPFYLDLGFSKTEIASIAKVFGFGMTLAGAALGGLLVARFGLMRPLLAGAVLVAATNLLFATLALSGPSRTLLTLVISADNLSGGIATAVFVAYLSSLTNTAYTATQYALFSSLMTLPAKLISGMSGIIVDSQGYFIFFVYAAILGLPAIGLVFWLMHHTQKPKT
jgi:PAT family beta-lactamase induction signal transducer AmpG